MTSKSKIRWVVAGIFLFGSFYLLSKPLFAYLNKEKEYLKEKSKGVELITYLPSFEKLAEDVISKEPSPDLTSGTYISYYNKVRELYPHLNDIHSFLGFFYAQNKQFDEAIEYYNRAIEYTPHFFWPYYNLALVYNRRGELDKSNKLLEEALKMNPTLSLYYIHEAGLYRQIWRKMVKPEEVITGNLKGGFEDCFGLLILNLQQVGGYQQILMIAQKAIEGNFSRREFYFHYAILAANELKQFKLAEALALKKKNLTAGKPADMEFNFRLF